MALLTGFALHTSAQQSVLNSGSWFKLSVEKEGVYKINFDLLKKMGIDPAKTDPRKIKIYGNAGGMLPQENNVARPSDLQENAIHVSGESDGKFDKQDFILFYTQGADRSAFNAVKDIHDYQKNLYSDKNFYFLTVGEGDGKRIAVAEDPGVVSPVVNTYNDYVFHELDQHSDRHSGREWFGEKFGIETNEHRFTFDINGIVSNSTIKLVSDVMGQSTSGLSFKLFLNNVQVAEQAVLPISTNQYGVKGLHRRDTLLIASNDVNAETRTTQELKYQMIKGEGLSTGYLDFFLLSFERALALYNDQTIFVSKKSLEQPVSAFEIASVPADAMIWDITDPYNIKKQNFSLSDQVATFSSASDALKKFVVFNSNIPAPVFAKKVSNQDLHGLTTPNLIIVTHPDFEAEAQRLAMHRENYSQMSVHVVTTEQVYNEFASGRQDVSAIRDFAKYLYDKNSASLKALLLFGRGSYDYKDRTPNNSNYVITYESRNSLHPLQSFSSDDYFAFLEEDEGYWGESPAQNHTLDIGVGRLPVRTISEAKNIVDKLIDYDTNKEKFGYWRKQIVFVADDGNSEDGFTSLHQYQADQLSQTIEDLGAGADVRKLFMGSYAKTVKPNGTTVPKLTDDVIRAFDKGALIINYTGHGSEDQWGDEDFFNTQTIAELKNQLYPFLVTATCEFGRNDDPAVISGAEKCVTLANAGAIGMVTTARPVNATTNFNLNEAFYEALFQREENSYLNIGEIFRRTKNNSTSGVSNRNFSLLGDPSMTLSLPPDVVVLTSITTAQGSDTLKALSTVTAKGEVRDFSGQKLTGFNGMLEATLFDKETTATTIGRNDPFTYSQWSNALFRGKATVINGEFQLTFVIPKNIAYQVAEGRFSMYAFDPVSNADASGFATDFKIGGSEEGVVADVTPPEIKLFMSDTTFVNGGITTPDTHLVALLSDNTGINISGYGIGNSIIAVLDGDADTFVLNDYYVADADNFAAGRLRYPIKDLSPGRHTLTVKAWDVYNNSTESTLDFIVTDGESLVIESFGNYPNPFRENTTLFFTHNRPGDDLKAQVFIQKTTGEVIKSGEIMISGSDYRVNLLELNTPDNIGKKLSAGLYLARVIVRSLTNGSKNEQVTKLIVLN